MANRREPAANSAPKRADGDSGRLVALQEGLRIDRDDLDSCLIEQPDRFYWVAEASVRARAKLDAAKLALEEAEARLDRSIRAEAERTEKKITEGRIDQEIKLSPDYVVARRLVMDLGAEADALQALKEAYHQRSFMLRELVALVIAERGDQSGARGAYEARGRRAEDAAAARTEALRQRRVGSTVRGAD